MPFRNPVFLALIQNQIHPGAGHRRATECGNHFGIDRFIRLVRHELRRVAIPCRKQAITLDNFLIVAGNAQGLRVSGSDRDGLANVDQLVGHDFFIVIRVL